MQPLKAVSRTRLTDIDYTRAFAILLVVIGHWQLAPMSAYWRYVINFIYTFHMPLFLALSGYLFMYTAVPGRSYLQFLSRKVRRLVVPYLTVSVIVILFKLARQNGMSVENPVTLKTFVEILYSPAAGYYLWFIWTLWWMFVICPWFKTPASRILLFIVAAFISNVPWELPDILCLSETKCFAVFFVAGMLLYDYRNYMMTRRPSAMWGGLALFVALEAANFCGVSLAGKFVPYVAIFAIPAFFRVIQGRMGPRLSRIMLSLASASYIIYLLHTMFMVFVRSVLLRYALGGDLQYAIAGAVEISVGLTVPWLLYVYILKRFAITRVLFGL